MASTTHPHAFHFNRAARSWWEASADPLGIETPPLTGDEACEVAVIGAGFTGLSAALELAEAGVDVRVIEAGQVGWGASGRNGGFACIGSHKLSYPTMIRRYGLDATKQYYAAMRQSVDLVRDNLQRFAIDAGAGAEGEVTLAHNPGRVAALREEQAYLRATFGDETVFLSKQDLKEQGLDGPGFHAGLKGSLGFGIHPLNYARGLARAAASKGAHIHGGTRLLRWEESDGGHRLHTAGGTLRAGQVIVATNGYTPEDVVPRLAGRLMPALSSILVTRPLSEAERAAQGWTSPLMAYDTRRLLHYFRLLPDGRFLFGGRGGTDASDRGEEAYAAVLVDHFRALFPAWAHVEITHQWRGLVCLTRDRVPYVGPLDARKSVWTAIAYHGNGVAMASWSGRAVARFLMKKAAREDISPVLTRRLARFPLAAFRPLYLKGAYAWYGLEDRR